MPLKLNPPNAGVGGAAVGGMDWRRGHGTSCPLIDGDFCAPASRAMERIRNLLVFMA